MYFNAYVVYMTFRIILNRRICIQIKLKPDICLKILHINKYNRGCNICNGNGNVNVKWETEKGILG